MINPIILIAILLVIFGALMVALFLTIYNNQPKDKDTGWHDPDKIE